MIHGDSDTFVPTSMLEENFNACKSYKEKLIVKGANHTEAEIRDPNGYWNTIINFINTVNKD